MQWSQLKHHKNFTRALSCHGRLMCGLWRFCWSCSQLSSRATLIFTKVLGQVASAARNLTSHAAQASKALSEKVKENAVTRYFYMQPGGVPNGPATAYELQCLHESGHITQEYVVAQAGSGTWLPIESILDRPAGAQPGQPCVGLNHHT